MNKITSIILTSIAVAGVLGYFLGYSTGGKAVAATYADRIAITTMMTPVRVDVRFVNGQIAQVKGSTVTVGKIILSHNPFAGDAPASREVIITDKTKITRILPNDIKVYNAEASALMKRFKENPELMKNPPPAPSMFIETPIKASDLKVGDMVVATAATDILQAPSFEATRIQIMMANPIGLK